MEGIVFDMKQMAVFDGPGIRTTVFLKGCPLRCQWCHNPEGLEFKPQLMVSDNGCLKCGKCSDICKHLDNCTACGECIRTCPLRLRKISGIRMTSENLVSELLRDRDYLMACGGGVTFSGGEPTAQPVFLLECLKKLAPMHRAIETSGYCEPHWFSQILGELDFVIMDIKMADAKKHEHYTGVSNQMILQNLKQLKESGKPFWIRIPVIPGVNDSDEDLRETAELLRDAKNLEKVELLPYHKTAGAKYRMIGVEYTPEFDTEREPNMNPKIFADMGIKCECL